MSHNPELPFEFDRHGETFGPPRPVVFKVVTKRRTVFNIKDPDAGHMEVVELNVSMGIKIRDLITLASNLGKSQGMRSKGQPEYDFTCLDRIFSRHALVGEKPFYRPDDINKHAIEEIKIGVHQKADLDTILYPADHEVTVFLTSTTNHSLPLIPTNN